MLEIEYGRLGLTTNSLVINSCHSYSTICCFRSYQGISVSIEINAKCREWTAMRMPADALIFKTDFNCSLGILLSFIFP